MGAKAKKSLIEPVDPDGLDLDSLDFSGMGFDDLDFSILDDGEAIEDRRDSEELVQEAEESGEDVYALERSQRKLIKYLDFHYERIRNVEDLVDPPKLNEQYRLVTQKGFNTFTFILYLLKKFKHIDNLDIITFNMNEGTISALMHLLDKGSVGHLRCVISDSIKFRMPNRVAQLRQEHEARKGTGRFDCAFVWNHAKIALVAIGDNRFVIEGSGNFSSNAEIEQYVFENNPTAYEFHKDWINDALFHDMGRGVRREILQ